MNRRYQLVPNKLLLLIILIHLGCNNNKSESEIINNLFGKEFNLPDHIVLFEKYEMDTVSIQYFKSNIKIISIIDGRCPACIKELNNFINVKTRIQRKTNSSIDYLFFIYTEDFKMFTQNFYPLLDFDSPILLTKDLSFLEKDHLSGFGKYRTVLTINNKIKLVGNPAVNKQLEDLYIDEINNYTKGN